MLFGGGGVIKWCMGARDGYLRFCEMWRFIRAEEQKIQLALDNMYDK